MSHVTTHNFAECSDEQIISQAREVLRARPVETLRVAHRRLLRSRKPDVQVAGKFLWRHLTTVKR